MKPSHYSVIVRQEACLETVAKSKNCICSIQLVSRSRQQQKAMRNEVFNTASLEPRNKSTGGSNWGQQLVPCGWSVSNVFVHVGVLGSKGQMSCLKDKVCLGWYSIMNGGYGLLLTYLPLGPSMTFFLSIRKPKKLLGLASSSKFRYMYNSPARGKYWPLLYLRKRKRVLYFVCLPLKNNTTKGIMQFAAV